MAVVLALADLPRAALAVSGKKLPDFRQFRFYFSEEPSILIWQPVTARIRIFSGKLFFCTPNSKVVSIQEVPDE